MKIQCDVCEKAPATVICCADEAALCSNCDVEIHAANKLASKHQRLLLECLSSKLPRCDICQEKAAFIFCVEDRALFCRDCDEAIHLPGSLSGKHQRFLATGIRVALASSSCTKDSEQAFLEPPNQNPPAVAVKMPVSGYNSPSWAVDDLLQLPDFGSGDKKDHLGFGELEWVSDIDLFDEQAHQEALAAAEVPELFTPNLSKPQKSSISHKKPRLEICDPEDYFTVPDLG